MYENWIERNDIAVITFMEDPFTVCIHTAPTLARLSPLPTQLPVIKKNCNSSAAKKKKKKKKKVFLVVWMLILPRNPVVFNPPHTMDI